jgi:hypothetical protein
VCDHILGDFKHFFGEKMAHFPARKILLFYWAI